MKRFLIISFLFLYTFSTAQDDVNKIQSMFMYHFTKYISWPTEDGVTRIGVLEDKAMYDEVSNRFATNKYEILYFDGLEAVKACDVLYVGRAKPEEVEQIKSRFSGKSMLLVSFRNGMAKNGTHINFVIQNGKMRFELNESSLSQANLQVSSNLKKLAILI